MMKCSLCRKSDVTFRVHFMHGHSDICIGCEVKLERRKRDSDWYDSQPKLYKLLHNRPVDERLEKQIIDRSNRFLQR